MEFTGADCGLSGSSYTSNDNATILKGTFEGDSQVTEFDGFTFKDTYTQKQAIQMKASSGKITFPSIVSECGFDVDVVFNTNTATVTIDGAEATGTDATKANLVIKTGSSYCQIASITLTPRVATATVTISSVKYATFSNSRATDFSETDITVYKAKASGMTVTLTKVEDGIVPANTGVILYSEVADTYDVPFTTTEATLSDNELVATVERVNVAKTDGNGHFNYILQSDDNGGLVFNMAKENGAYMPAGRAYLSTTVDASATASPTNGNQARLRVVIGGGDVVTGIETVEARAQRAADGCYDLQGRRVAQSQRGLYIVNGKKVVK